jgi:hypothetical protein
MFWHIAERFYDKITSAYQDNIYTLFGGKEEI